MPPVRSTFIAWLGISVSGIAVLKLAKDDIDRRRRRVLEEKRGKESAEPAAVKTDQVHQRTGLGFSSR
ncbi:hypothetical protein M427DRAFT_135280 [Gonapodya prolifera JEL478]|uniref:Uncharacterized protein n=1 Tax=Gonapodya prolifera (strain JEL478) TaxID=1344416 RepID=A0A139AFI8_GONPJ|nr:hypothetical protein M427DRAFT_135280 [Gonapodya prolifera JEL478]|eukprot:KXS15334.1 hypothetical protein M427DRAFT_135280 [Gonapodya prolifera JEL478]